MSGLFEFIANLFRMLFKINPVKKIQKQAKKEVKREKESGGMESIRKSTSDYFRRNRR